MREVLIIRFGALGDLVLATVLLEALRNESGPVRITWVTKRRWASLLEDDPRIDELAVLEEGESVWSLAGRLAADYDLVLDAHANLRSFGLDFLLRSGETRRLAKDTVARWLFRHGLARPSSLRRRLVDRYLELVPGADRGLRPRIHVEPGDGPRVPQGGRPRVALAVGATHAPKQWDPSRFREVATGLGQRGHEVLIVGGPEEKKLAESVATGGAAEVWDAQRPLRELARELAGCALLVGNDSGLLHLAEAVGTEVVGIFGPTVKEWGYFPWRANSRVLEHELECRPCSKMGDRPCRLPEQLCLTRTTAADVMRTIDEVLDAT